MELKLKLGEIMKDRKLTLDKLHEKSNIDKSVLSRYRRDIVERLDKSVIVRLCEALNITPSELIVLEK